MSDSRRGGAQEPVPTLRYNIMRPSEFMRSRRPYLFSDSEIVSAPRLTRELLDHHLNTLTNRKEENGFEHLCRRLAEKEICPNLRPQTGPIGGGDSKVDSETYPVSTEIAQSWYEGDQAAAQEMWAFAFSAKKDWRSKVRSDVKSIKSTGRPYRRIYFITNQYVRDKVGPEVEGRGRTYESCLFPGTYLRPDLDPRPRIQSRSGGARCRNARPRQHVHTDRPETRDPVMSGGKPSWRNWIGRSRMPSAIAALNTSLRRIAFSPHCWLAVWNGREPMLTGVLTAPSELRDRSTSPRSGFGWPMPRRGPLCGGTTILPS